MLTDKLSLIGAFCVAGLLSACSSSGGGEEANEGVVYAGVATAAAVTRSNSTTFAATVLRTDESMSVVDFLSEETDTASGPVKAGVAMQWAVISEEMGATLDSAVTVSNEKRKPAQAIDESVACNSGSIRVVGDINDSSGAVDADLMFNQCVFSGVAIDGEAHIVSNPANVSLIISFDLITVSGTDFDFAQSGSVSVVSDSFADTSTATLNLTIEDRLRNETIRFQNFQYQLAYDDIQFPNSFSAAYSGRLFHSQYGYVDVSTVTPLCHSSLLAVFPDCGGEILMTGSGNATIRLIAISGEQVQVYLDADGDTVEEVSEIISWSDLVARISLE